MCSYLSAVAIPEEAVTVELLLEHIIETFHTKNTEKLVLLVELGCIRHEAVQNINFLLELSEISQVHDCYVVVATNSGSGRRVQRTTMEYIALYENLQTTKSSLYSFCVKNFNEQEAFLFMEKNYIDTTKLKSHILPITRGNPLLLGCFRNTLLDEESFEGATQQVDSQIISRSC